eukprot:GHVL01014218.1.p1 GENE.GHVL01014218.1~~GHVL01014218.1.p1  ORF type:complete len:112 (-),score=5.04 GHVL01014218.1:226-561(-)
MTPTIPPLPLLCSIYKRTGLPVSIVRVCRRSMAEHLQDFVESSVMAATEQIHPEPVGLGAHVPRQSKSLVLARCQCVRLFSGDLQSTLTNKERGLLVPVTGGEKGVVSLTP